MMGTFMMLLHMFQNLEKQKKVYIVKLMINIDYFVCYGKAIILCKGINFFENCMHCVFVFDYYIQEKPGRKCNKFKQFMEKLFYVWILNNFI